MGGSFPLLTVRGITLRVHITFPLILIWAMLQFGLLTGQGWNGAIFGVIVTLLLFTIVVLHELGHSIAAQNYGVPVNEIVLLPIGGVAQLERMPDNPQQEFVIAIAGPAVNFVIAVIMIALNRLTGIGSSLGDINAVLSSLETLSVDAIFSYLFAANLFIAIFNLIPAFPMDGGRVLRALLATRLDYLQATNIAVTVGQGLAFLMGLWGFLGGGFFLILIAIFIYMGASYEGRMVQFRSVLGDLKVDQAFSRQTQTLRPDAPLREAIQITLTSFQADFPVCDGDQLVGMLPYRRLVEALDQNGAETPVRAVMLTDIPPARPDEGLFDVQQRMMENNLDAVPVIEDGGRFLGILTMRDISEVYRMASTRPDLLARLRERAAA